MQIYIYIFALNFGFLTIELYLKRTLISSVQEIRVRLPIIGVTFIFTRLWFMCLFEMSYQTVKRMGPEPQRRPAIKNFRRIYNMLIAIRWQNW